MNDAENLSKLLSHLPPAAFHEFMQRGFAVVLDPLDPKQGKREQRAGMAAALSALTVGKRQRIEEVAERLVLLSDGAGQDVIEGLRADICGGAAREAFAAIPNQYERALWLHTHEPLLFDEALSARQADVFRQSSACYSGFIAPAGLRVADDEPSRAAFHQAVAQQLGCAADAVAVHIFKRLRPDTRTGEDVSLYQISIHHNRAPELVDRVQASEVVPQEVVRAVSSHLTYEPASGHLEVLSKDADAREALARLAADALLCSPITGERIPLKVYSYQSLAAPRHFDIAGEPVSAVKVIELGYAVPGHRSLRVKIWTKDAEGIHAAARALIGPTFDFRSHRLNYARIAVTTRKAAGERARTLNIVLRDDNKCNVKTQRERDRALCDRLLARWGLIREIGDALGPVVALAA